MRIDLPVRSQSAPGEARVSRQAMSEPSEAPQQFSSSSRLASVGPSRRSAPAYAEYGATCNVRHSVLVPQEYTNTDV